MTSTLIKTLTERQALQLAYSMLRTIEQGGSFDHYLWHMSLAQMAHALDGTPAGDVLYPTIRDHGADRNAAVIN